MADFSFYRSNDLKWFQTESPPKKPRWAGKGLFFAIGGIVAAVAILASAAWFLTGNGTPPLQVQVASLDSIPEVNLARLADFHAPQANPNHHYFSFSQQEDLKRTDGFVHHLKEKRLDLAGLPFQMSPDCTLPAAKALLLKQGSLGVRAALGKTGLNRVRARRPETETPELQKIWSNNFWAEWRDNLAAGKRPGKLQINDQCQLVQVEPLEPVPTTLPALTQILDAEGPSFRLDMVSHVRDMAGLEVSQILARRAIFDVDPEVRKAALDSLSKRPLGEFSQTLVEGLRYPLPQVAQQASKALVFLKATELAPKLVDLFEEHEPAAPFTVEQVGQKVSMVREVVRVNHHRNCLLCHPPSTKNEDLVRGLVPDPHQSFFSPSGDAYGGTTTPPEGSLFIKADTTYLRQDFSAMLPVADTAPWPTMQRFDFLVRTRLASREDERLWQEQVSRRQGGVSPHRLAVLHALRELTGQDHGTSAPAWRKALAIAK